MITLIYSLYDVKGRQYHQMQLHANNNCARRAYTEQLQDEKSMIRRWPSDFTVYFLGQFNTETGVIDTVQGPPEYICSIDELFPEE